MAAFADTIKALSLRCGDRINPLTFCNIQHQDDSKLSPERKSAASISSYKKHFKAEHIDVPKAEFKEVDRGPPVRVHTYTQEFVKFVEKTKEDYDKMIEYDCDEEDYLWIEYFNEKYRKKKDKLLTTDAMELVMDRLEKESHFEVKGSSSSFVAGSSVDMDDVCCVCGDGDVSNVNQIIYCDMCNIAVHQDCYGVPYIPEGQWLCRRCKLSPSAPVRCCLCPNTSGAFKQTSDGRWAHVVCAIWLNEVHFANAVFLEPIEGVDNSLRRRSKLKCLVCRQKMGACLQCSTRSCLKAFHVTCAQQSGMAMKVHANPDPSSTDQVDVQRFVFCHLHADDDDCDATSRKKRMDDAIRQARRSMATKSSRTPRVNMPTISSEALESIAKRAGFDITDIIQYWYMKRKSRCGVPLIRRLQVNQKVSRVSISHADMDDEDKTVYDRITKMRYSLETARLLSEQVKKRELHKKSHVRTSHDIFEAVFLPYSFIIDDTLERLCHKDKHCVFAEPVTIEGYRSVIKQPMDLSTMKKKAAEGKYDSIGAMRTDFLLMTDNCEKFNKTHEWYLKYGRKFRKIGLGLLETAERRIRDMEKLQIGGDVILSEVSRVNYYESNDEDSCVKENEPDTDDERPELRNSRRISASEATDLKRPTTINNIDLGGFLTPRDSGKGMFTFNGTTPKSKRKNDQEATPALKRRKKDSMALSPFRQAPITKFFATSPVILSDRRSTLRHAAPAPLMAFRENSVTSPLPADVASSESSTEEYETRPNRRSARRGDHAKIDIQEASDPEGYHHNDLVVVDGIAGRVIDPVDARVDGDLPKALVSECRLASRKDSQICVFLFENENKWGWYPSCDVRLLNLNGNDGDGLSTTSYKLAKKWQKQMVEVYNK